MMNKTLPIDFISKISIRLISRLALTCIHYILNTVQRCISNVFIESWVRLIMIIPIL